MDQLIKEVSQAANISEDKARIAVEKTLDFVKAKLPASVSSQIDQYLENNPEQVGNAINMAKDALGGLFKKSGDS